MRRKIASEREYHGSRATASRQEKRQNKGNREGDSRKSTTKQTREKQQNLRGSGNEREKSRLEIKIKLCLAIQYGALIRPVLILLFLICPFFIYPFLIHPFLILPFFQCDSTDGHVKSVSSGDIINQKSWPAEIVRLVRVVYLWCLSSPSICLPLLSCHSVCHPTTLSYRLGGTLGVTHTHSLCLVSFSL